MLCHPRSKRTEEMRAKHRALFQDSGTGTLVLQTGNYQSQRSCQCIGWTAPAALTVSAGYYRPTQCAVGSTFHFDTQ
jgi:hypothetical protein